jgi:hypothetical protein
MRVPLSSALVFLSLVGVASAATEQEKRRLHVPSVTSATNCIVEQVRRDLRPNSSAADVSTAINSAMPTCRKGLNRMVDQHDRIYGRGTGRKFLEGPYLHDLARAVSERIESVSSPGGKQRRDANPKPARRRRAAREIHGCESAGAPAGPINTRRAFAARARTSLGRARACPTRACRPPGRARQGAYGSG